jgi:hypothetical protein
MAPVLSTTFIQQSICVYLRRYLVASVVGRAVNG